MTHSTHENAIGKISIVWFFHYNAPISKYKIRHPERKELGMSLHGFGHTYAGNPLDRGEVERRNEHWIASRALDPSTRLIPARGIDFLLNFTPEPSLVWFNAKDSRHLYQKGSELFLGLDGDVAYFTAPLSDKNS